MTRLRKLIFSSVVAGAGALVAARLYAPKWLREKIVSSLQESCPQCKVQLGDVRLDASQSQITFSKFSYVDSPGHHDQIEIHFKQVQASIDLRELMQRRFFFHSVVMDGVDFTVKEDGKIKSPSDDSAPLAGLPPLVFMHTEVRGSRFRYVDVKAPTNATLVIEDMSGEIGAWATRSDLARKYASSPTSIKARGRIENAGGRFSLECHADPLSRKGSLDIRLLIKDQSLLSVNGFFLNEFGLTLEGELYDIVATLKMKEGQSQASISGRYSGLKVHVSDPHSSEISNFFANLESKIVISQEQGVNNKPIANASVSDQRTGTQSLISAIFHALGKAAKDLVKG